MRAQIAVILTLLVGVGAFAQNLERESFLDAESRFLSKDYALALERYDEFIKAWPDSAYQGDARYRRAVTLYRLGRLDEAYAAFERVEIRYRGTKYLSYVPFWKAVIDYDRGRLEAAASLFKTVLASPPDKEAERQALLYRGKALTALGHGQDAQATFEALLALLPKPEDEPSAILFLTGLYAKSGANQSIVDLWERLDPALLNEETRERVSLYAAQAYATLGKSSEAITLFDRLSSSTRKDIAIEALQRLLAVARKSGTEEEVSSVVIKAESALRSEPSVLSEFWLRVGEDAFEDHRDDLARSYFLRISALLPPEKVPAEVPIYLAAIADREGNKTEAYAILAEGAPRAGDRAALSYAWLGRYALDLGRWKDAETALRSALAAAKEGKVGGFSDRAVAESLIGRYLSYALMKQGADEDALTIVDQTGVADLSGGLRFRAEVLARSGAVSNAAELLTELVKAAPSDSEPRVALMNLLYSKNQYERVLQEAQAFDAAVVAPKAGTAEADQYNKILFPYSRYLAGVSAAATGKWSAALDYFDAISELGRASLGSATGWADFYRSWAAYKLSRFKEARDGFTAFLAANQDHPASYGANYFSAWCSAGLSDYTAGATSAATAAKIAEAEAAKAGAGSATLSGINERISKARYLEGKLRSFLSDWNGAIKAYDAAVAAKGGAYAARASFERGVTFDLAGKVDEADSAFAKTAQDYQGDPLAEDATFRRGETLYRAGRYAAAVDRFAAYRNSFPSGRYVDAALYLNGLASKRAGKIDAAILLWERLLASFPTSRYRFPSLFQAAISYREKGDLEAAFRSYTSAIAEFGERAKAAGAADEADILRYRITGLPENVARLHVAIKNARGATTAEGRKYQLALAAFYIQESGQREAGLPLLDEVIALKDEDPVAAAEASALKGDYYSLIGSLDKAASSFLDAATWGAAGPADATTRDGSSVRDAFVPEQLYKAAFARKRDGRDVEAAEIAKALEKSYPNSTWTAQVTRLVGASK